MPDGNGQRFGRGGQGKLAGTGVTPDASSVVRANEMTPTSGVVPVDRTASPRRPKIVKVREGSVVTSSPARATRAPSMRPGANDVDQTESMRAPWAPAATPDARTQPPKASRAPVAAAPSYRPQPSSESLRSTGKMLELDDHLQSLLRAAKDGVLVSSSADDGEGETKVFSRAPAFLENPIETQVPRPTRITMDSIVMHVRSRWRPRILFAAVVLVALLALAYGGEAVSLVFGR